MKKKSTKKIIKFLILTLIITSYFIYVSHKFGLSKGGLVTVLSWSFFVLCTPIPDGGFLIDFPVRLITNIKMTITELLAWTIAISTNVYAYLFNKEIYQSTKLLIVLGKIIKNPFPYWSIILISGIGTFLSIYLGDKVLDKIHNEDYINKKRILIYIIVISITILFYVSLVKNLNINLTAI